MKSSRNLWIKHKTTKSLPYRNVGFWQLRVSTHWRVDRKVKMNITVKMLREVYKVTPEDISNALSITPNDVIRRCLENADTYAAFAAIGILIPRELLKFEPPKVQEENEKKWVGIKSIFDALGNSEKGDQKRHYKPRTSVAPPSIEADMDTFKSMCLDGNISYGNIAHKFGLSEMNVRYYALKLNCHIERKRGRKKPVQDLPAKTAEMLENPFAGFNTSAKPGF